MSIVAAKKKRRAGSGDDGMIPMINIVFLLLVFFMIAGQITPRDTGVELPASVSEAEIAEQQLAVSIDTDGQVRVDGDPVDGDLVSHLATLVEARGGDPVVVTCRVHRELPAQVLDPVLQAARELRIKRLQIVTEWQP